MRPLHDPAARPIPRILLLGLNLFSPLAHMRRIMTLFNRFLGWLSGVAFIRAQVLLPVFLHLWAFNHDLIQRRLQQFHIMFLRPARDYRQRDSIRVDEQAALRPIFFPDPWGWGRPFPVPMAL